MQNTLFTSAVTGEEKLRTDVIAIVQNEITVVDEHTPSPGEIQSDETIVLPEIISMTEYIRRHCEREIVAACKNQIDMLRLCVVEVSNIGYTQAAREQSREGWRFAKQIRPDLDCGKTSDNCVWLSGTLGRMALFTT